MLSRLNDLVEKQGVQLLELCARLKALEASFDTFVSQAVDDRTEHLRAAETDMNNALAALRTAHADIERRIASLPSLPNDRD